MESPSGWERCPGLACGNPSPCANFSSAETAHVLLQQKGVTPPWTIWNILPSPHSHLLTLYDSQWCPSVPCLPTLEGGALATSTRGSLGGGGSRVGVGMAWGGGTRQDGVPAGHQAHLTHMSASYFFP